MTQCPVRAVPRLPRRTVRNQIRVTIDGQRIGTAVQAAQLRHARRSVATRLRLRKGGPMLPGVDVSSFQGQPEHWSSAAGNISWAAVKWTELQPDGSHYVNPDAATDWAWLRDHGKGRIAYLFGRPATAPSETVTLFAQQLRAAGLEDGDGIALDLEVSDGRSPAQVAAWARAVTAALQHGLGRAPLLYTFLSFAEAGNCAGLGHLPLWLADPSSPPGQPRVPAPWSAWAVHQYAITGAIDRDLARWPDLAAMAADLGTGTPAPEPSPPPAAAFKGDDLMLLNKGSGAMTPIALPKGATGLRFVSAGEALLHVEFHGHGAKEVRLSWAGGAHRLAAPEGVHAARVVRGDSGAGDVSVVAE